MHNNNDRRGGVGMREVDLPKLKARLKHEHMHMDSWRREDLCLVWRTFSSSDRYELASQKFELRFFLYIILRIQNINDFSDLEKCVEVITGVWVFTQQVFQITSPLIYISSCMYVWDGRDTWHVRETKETGFWWGDLWEREHLEDLSVDGNGYSRSRMVWIDLAEDTDRWRPLVNVVT